MKKTMGAALFAAGWVATVSAQMSVIPAPQSEDPNSWWQKRFQEKQELVKAGGADVVFIGDSITHFWEGKGRAVWEKYFAQGPYKALNLGFSGDRTEHVLWRLDHGELDGFKPKAIVLMIGTNNTGHRPVTQEPPADTVIGVKAVLEKIRSKAPGAKIILCAIFPRGEQPTDGCRVRNEIVNTEIKKFADDRTVFWCDFNDQMLTPDGVLTQEMMNDRLHPEACGYEIWAKAVIPYLNRAIHAPNAPRTVAPESRGRDGWWFNRLSEKRTQILKDADKQFDVVFFGDSITHGWEGAGRKAFAEKFTGYDILNIGYGGDRTEHLVWRGLNGELDGYKAKVVMLMIGTNNGGDSAEDVAAGIKRILEVIAQKQPEAKTLLLPIFPRNADAKNAHRIKNEKTNAIIKGYADGQKVIWCDFNAKFLKDNDVLPRELMPDLLHPNYAGYLIWADAVLPYFKEICGK